MNNSPLYFSILNDLASNDNIKRTLAEKASIYYMKSQTSSFFQFLIDIITQLDGAALKNYALALLTEMVRSKLIDSLLDMVHNVCWIVWDNQDTRGLAQICYAEALVVDTLKDESEILRLLKMPCFKSLSVFKVFSEISRIARQDLLEIVIKVLKDCLNSEDLVLVSVQCLKNCGLFINDHIIIGELGLIMSLFCAHFNEKVRFECLDGLLEICEGFQGIYIEKEGLIRVLGEDCCQNKWIATCILNYQQVQINPEIFGNIVKNLYENELWEISIEYLTTSFGLENSEDYLKNLIFTYKNEPVVFLAILCSLPNGYIIDSTTSSIFFQYFFTDSLKLKEKAVFVLCYNQYFTKSIINPSLYSELLKLIFNEDITVSIKISSTWAIYNTLDKKTTQRQAEFFIIQFLQLKGNHELISVAFLVINQLLPLCSQTSIQLIFFPLFIKQFIQKSDDFTSNCILSSLTNSISLLYPKYYLPESLIRELLNSFLKGHKSSDKLEFLEALNSLYPSTYSKFEVLISLYSQKV